MTTIAGTLQVNGMKYLTSQMTQSQLSLAGQVTELELSDDLFKKKQKQQDS